MLVDKVLSQTFSTDIWQTTADYLAEVFLFSAFAMPSNRTDTDNLTLCGHNNLCGGESSPSQISITKIAFLQTKFSPIRCCVNLLFVSQPFYVAFATFVSVCSSQNFFCVFMFSSLANLHSNVPPQEHYSAPEFGPTGLCLDILCGILLARIGEPCPKRLIQLG